MDRLSINHESHIISSAINDFINDAVAANQKVKKIKQNMEYRRKLEQRKEELRLRRETSEFEFELLRNR